MPAASVVIEAEQRPHDCHRPSVRTRHRRERRELASLLAPREIRRRRQIIAIDLHMMTARRLTEDKDDLLDVVAVLENLDRLTGQRIVDISRRAVLIVRLLEIRRKPANRKIPRQLLHTVLRVRSSMAGRACKQN